MESDPIGLYGGSASTYSYTNNNPISRSDPPSTTLGYALWLQLELSPTKYVVGDGVLGKAFPQGRYINVDPNYHPVVNTSCGPQAASTPVILGHEFGHVLRGDTVEDAANEAADIRQFENPLRVQLNLPIRLP